MAPNVPSDLPGWWSAAAAWTIVGITVIGAVVTIIRRDAHADARIKSIEISLADHVSDCSKKTQDVKTIIESISKSQMELQGQIYAVQVAQQRQTTVDDLQRLSDSVIRAIDARRRES